jgi:hypothetical protein
MKSMRQKHTLSPGDSSGALAACLMLLGLLSACGGQTDDRFSAESEDEYTQPLTRALIGTPDGRVVRSGPEGTVVVPGTGPSSDEGDVVIIGAGGGSSGGGGGSGGSGQAGSSGNDSSGFGFWHFDDCLPNSHFLADSSGFGASAQQALGAECVPGISDQAVQIRSQQDVIQIPDQPQFTVASRVAVAAWVNPSTVRGDQPIVIKRLNNQTSFSLGIHNGNIEMSVVLDDGTTVISRAPIEANTFTHVAGMFDGTFVFLFINGEQFGQIYAAGSLRNVFAPIRIGATSQSQYFDGIIDEVFVSTQEISKETLQALSCIHHPTTFTVDPDTSGLVPPNTSVSYDLAVSNNDVGACGDSFYDVFFSGTTDPGLTAFFDTNFQSASPGSTSHFTATVTGSEDADPGVHRLPFNIFASSNNAFEQFDGEFVYELSAPTGCFVSSRRELMITSLSVVDDPVRTAGNASGTGGIIFPPPGSADAGAPLPTPLPSPGSGSGVWSFAHLMRELAPTPEAAPAMLEQMLKTFTTDQVVNGFRVALRPGMQTTILNAWPRTPTGELDLDRAPVTLQAIVNRLDVRDLTVGSGGEGRFVFGVNDPSGFALQFTMIFEYNLPAKTEQDVLDWANLWHGLQAQPFPSEEYNAALEEVTRRFSSRDASPGSVNGSALFSFRTNEIDLGNGAPWELRQFELSPETGFFRQIPLSETPDLSFNGTPTFADFVNQNAAAIISLVPGGTGNTVPLQFEGQNFQAGSALNSGFVQWSADGIQDPEARFHASTNTCNGCHGTETGSGFLQITPRGFTGGEAGLSPFITGTTVFDPFTGEPRTLNDLARRRVDMTQLVCPPGTVVTTPPLPPNSGGIGPVPAPPPIALPLR